MNPGPTQSTQQPAAAALCFLAGCLPFVFAVNLYEPYLAAKQILLVAGAAGCVLLAAATTRAVPVTPLWWPLGALAIFCGAAARLSPRWDATLNLLAALALFAVAASAFAAVEWRRQLAAVITAAGAFEAVLVLLQAAGWDPLYQAAALPGKWRMFGTFGNPNWTGEFLAMALLVTLGGLTVTWSRTGLAALLLIAAGLAATFARGAWVACGIGVAAILIARGGRVPRRLLVALGVAAGVVTLLLILQPDMRRYLVNFASIRGRWWIWSVTAHLIAAHPLGVGLGSFARYYPIAQAQLFETPFGRQFLSSAAFPPQAHNDYLQLAAEAGWPALIPAIVLIWMVLRRGRGLREDGAALGLWAAVVAMLADALYGFPFTLPGSLGLTAICLGAAEAAAARQRPLTVSRRGRVAVCAALLALALPAWLWCWRLGVSEFALRRGATAIDQQAWEQAAVESQRALANDPQRMEAHALAGRLALARHRFDAAIAAYSRAAELGYEADTWLGRATALWQSGRKVEAVAILGQLSWLRPDQIWIRKRMIEMHAALPPEERRP